MDLALPCVLQPDLVAIDGMPVPNSCSTKALRKRPPADTSDVSITQAQLLFSRGDFINRKTCFDVSLDEPTLCNVSGSRETFARLGARVVKPTADTSGMLRVERVFDRVGNAASPVAKWNASQCHKPELMVKSGDHICASDSAIRRIDTSVLKSKPRGSPNSKSKKMKFKVERSEPTLFEPCSTFWSGHPLDVTVSVTERDCVASVYHDTDGYDQFLAIAISREPCLTEVEGCSTESVRTTEKAPLSIDEGNFPCCNSIVPRPRSISFSGVTSSECRKSPCGFVGRIIQGIRKKTARVSNAKTRLFDNTSDVFYMESTF